MLPTLIFLVFAVPQDDHLLGLPRSLLQQEAPSKDVPPAQEPVPPPPAQVPTLSIAAVARVLFSSGEIDNNILITGSISHFDRMSWSDAFTASVGGSLELDLIWEDPSRNDATVGGVYAAIGFDSFLGRKVSDAFGAFIDPENLQVLSFLVGPKLVKHFDGGYFLDWRLGVGVVHYSRVDAEMTTTTFGIGGQTFRGEFLADTTTLGMELGFRGGVRSGTMSFVLGVDFRLFGKTEGGKAVNVTPSGLMAFGLDFGVELGF